MRIVTVTLSLLLFTLVGQISIGQQPVFPPGVPADGTPTAVPGDATEDSGLVLGFTIPSLPKDDMHSLYDPSVLISLSAIASFTIARPTVAAAIIVMLVAALSLVALLVIGLWNRRPLPVVVACCFCCYLCVADGGMSPATERFLPTEWLFGQCSRSHTRFDSGRKRSVSLSKWIWRLCVEEDHKDWHAASTVAPPRPTSFGSATDADASPVSTTVKLPTMAFTTVTTVRTLSKRDDPENRTFFIIGHCWCVISIAIPALMLWFKRDTALVAL